MRRHEPALPQGGRAWRYGLAVVLTTGCVLLRESLDPLLGEHLPILVFMIAVFGAAYIGGVGPGVLATGLSLLGSRFYFMEPAYAFWPISVADAARLIIFGTISLGICVLSGRLQRLLREAQAAACECARSEQRFRATFENNAVGISHVDKEGRWIRYNRRLCEMLGCDFEELKGSSVFDWTHPEERGQERRQFGRLVRGEIDHYSVEKRYVRTDGGIIWAEVGRSLVRDSEGHPDYVITVVQDISSRIAARNAQDEMTRRLADVLTRMGDSFLLVEPDLSVATVNPAAQRFLGKSEERIVGSPLSEVFPAEPFLRQLEYGVQHALARHFDGYFPKLNAWLDVHAYPAAEGFAIYFRDISARKRAERAVAESEARFRHLADAMPHGVWTADPNGKLEYSNARYSELTNSRIGEDVADVIERNLHPEDALLFHNSWRGARASGEAFNGEYRILERGTGQYRWGLIQSVPERDGEGRVVRWFGSATDIHQTKDLQEQFAWFNSILGLLAGNGQQLLLGDDPIPLISNLCRDVMGLLGCQIFVHYLSSNEDGTLHLRAHAGLSEDFIQRIAKLNRTPAVCGSVAKSGKEQICEHVLERTDPETELVRSIGIRAYACHPLRVRERFLGTLSFGSRTKDTFSSSEVSVMRLVSDHIASAIERLQTAQAAQEYTRALEKSRREAQEANAAKDDFIAVLSHELRTPLTPALAAAGLIKDDARLPAELRPELEIIRRNIEIEKRLIDDLLDLTRVVQGKLEMEFSCLDLNASVQQAIEICRPDIAAKGMHMKWKSHPGLHVWGDDARLQQVFWNLISNAVKFTPPGGCLEIAAYSPGSGKCAVSVRDSGRGIAQDELARVFDAFEQLDRRVTRRFGGLGLGLAISKAIVSRHGGEIVAGSAGRGEGSTFTVILPALIAQEHGTKESGPVGSMPEESGRPLRILLVEDHDDTARIVARLLRKAGHDVTTAGNVASALDIAAERPFDLLISDLGLPDGSGLDLMRKLSEERHINGIALSGYGMEEDIRQSEEAGFVEHLTKPVNVNRLRQVIRRFSK